MKTFISIVIILKNDLGIIDTIEGLNRQDYSEKFEIIVVDRSTIKYPKIISKIPLRWINFEPKGKRYTIPEQRNRGIAESKGNIIVFIDASCVPNQDWLIQIIKPIIKEGEKIVMGKTGSIGKSTLNDLSHEKLTGIKYVEEAPTINLAISKDVINKAGLFDTNLEYGSDADFSWRATDFGYKIRYYPPAYVAHNWGSAKDEIKRSFLYGRGRTRIIIKHWKTKWKNLLGVDSMLFVYPTIIFLLPLTVLFHWYPIVFLLLILKNIGQPKPLEIVYKHIIYGWGALTEVKDQISKYVVKNI